MTGRDDAPTERAAAAAEFAAAHESPVAGLRIRPVESGDVPRLREIAEASKGHWGYDRRRVRDWAASLDFSPAAGLPRELYLAEVDDRPIAWLALIPGDGACELDDLWVDRPWIGRRIGSYLFAFAAARAGQLGAHVLEWGAEPNSIGFYERMGGRYVRDRTSVWGRITPVMAVDVAGPAPDGTFAPAKEARGRR